MIKFTVWGDPVAQGRPRFARQGNFVRAYDPEKSRSYKQLVYVSACEVKPNKLLEGPLSLTVKAYRGIPKSFSKKKMEQALSGELRPITKPDLDNIIKPIKDAIKGIVWKDDSNVVEIFAEKYYTDSPRVEIEVRRLSDYVTCSYIE